jgi:FAD-linked oxidoreductase
MKPAAPCHKPASSWRRQFLRAGASYLAAAIISQPLRAASAANPATSSAKTNSPYRWSNWSGNAQCTASQLATPADSAAVASLLQQNQGSVRCVGAGHSFSALVPTDGILLSLDRMSGILNHDKNQNSVTVAAGTRLALLSRQLDALGLGMPNLPDIDLQSLAGAVSSATHGTGASLPAMHASIQALRLVTAQGDVIDCSGKERPDLLAASQVSLGALGVITQLTLKVMPAYNLQRKVWLEPLDAMLEKAPQLAEQHRHFEFYYLPFTGYCAAITHDLYTGNDVLMPPSQDEAMLKDLQTLRNYSSRFPSLRRWLAKKLIDTSINETARNRSFRLLSSPRPTRFYETESHVPRANGIACVKAVIARLEQRNDVFFPLEFRYVKGDDAWLSPFYQRDSCSIAVHALHGEEYGYLTSEIGPVVRQFGARPHWGKLHQFSSSELAALYPRWIDFLTLRQQLDPRGRMLNAHTRQLFGMPT